MNQDVDKNINPSKIEPSQLKNILEAAMMVADEPLSLDRMASLFREDGGDPPDKSSFRQALDLLQQDYAERGIELKEVASGFRLQAKSETAQWVNRLWTERTPKYSRALLETLAIIAYRQPITRGEIEAIRGVGVSSGVMKTLQEREWVKVAGHRDVPGRPAVFATTKIFLDYFNLKTLSELPTLAELRDLDEIAIDLFPEQAKVENDQTIAEQDDQTESNTEQDEQNNSSS